MIRLFLIAGIVLLSTSLLNAEPPQSFANRLAASGQLYHDQSASGRENVFYSSNAVLPRMQARAAWRKSPGHRANLPMVGLRVARGANGVYVVGRR
jgi:hypothetical protein